MDNYEAHSMLQDQLTRLRGQRYKQLLRFLNGPVGVEVLGQSGISYSIEIEAMWDCKAYRDLRVSVSIDDGSLLRAVVPLNQDFIIRPDGSFVGE